MKKADQMRPVLPHRSDDNDAILFQYLLQFFWYHRYGRLYCGLGSRDESPHFSL